MKQSRRGWPVGAALLVVVLAGVCVLALPSVEDALFLGFVEHHLRHGQDELFQDDALKVLLCGTSAPFADAHRAQSCVAVIAGGRYYLVDAGPGSGRNLQLWQMPGERLGAVLLTHFHSDHVGDLWEINTNAWLGGHAGRLPVFGGPGVQQVVDGFNQAYALDQSYRTANSGAELLPLAAAVMQPVEIDLRGEPTARMDRNSLPIHFGELTVTAIEVNHEPASPAYGYRFDYRGRSAVISGDTRAHPPLAVAARDADVLVHEAQSQHLVDLIERAAWQVGKTRIAHLMADIHGYHTDPLEAAEIANQAHARLVVFTHLDPPVENPLVYRMFYRGMSRVRDGDWLSGKDGMLISLPVGSKEVKVSEVNP